MPDATRTIFVHIGIPKTGTTTLQGWLSRNRASLAAQGVLYPLATPNHNDLYLALCEAPHQEHHLIRLGYTDAAAARERADQFATELAGAIQSSKAPKVLISGESLSRLSSEGVARLARWLAPMGKAHIVCCLRDPLHYAVSDAQEAIKGGLTYDQVCRDPPTLNYRALLEPYLTTFGADRVTVFPFAPQTGLDRAFAAATGLPVAFDPDEPPGRHNQALSLEAALLLSDLNARIPMYIDTGANPRRGVIPLSWLEGIGSTPFGLPARSLGLVRRRTRADVAWVRQQFGLDLAAARPDDGRAPPMNRVSQPVAAMLPSLADTLHRAACLVGDLIAARLLEKARGTEDLAHRVRLLEQALTVRPGQAEAIKALNQLASEAR